jgi:multidrug efflux system outer membrane protein
MRKLSLALLAAASLFATSAGAVGPKYKPPVDAPVVLANAAPEAVTITAQPEAEWWKLFGDPVLDSLVTRALSANLDLRIAEARVREARALFRDVQLDQFPRVTTSAAYSDAKQQIPGFPGGRREIESATVGFDAAWEIDLFGRVRHGVQAARADAQATEADRRGAEVAVAAEVARNYFELRGAQARRVVAEANAEAQRETLRLTEVRLDVGRGDPVDAESARARLNAIEASIPELVSAEARARHRLAVLAGQRPGALDAELTPVAKPLVAKVTPLPIGDASTFLRRRPDVQAAERRLAAETARTGVATADLFPRISVSGFIGFLSGDISGLFKSGSEAWSVSPSVSWPGLDIGGARARLKAQKARGDQSLAVYDQTVLRAVEELENALVAYRQRQLQLASLARQVDASRSAADLARIRYKEGSIDFLVLLDAERTRLQAEDALTAAQTAAETDIVTLYKVLGGGWA